MLTTTLIILPTTVKHFDCRLGWSVDIELVLDYEFSNVFGNVQVKLEDLRSNHRTFIIFVGPELML